MTELSNAVTVLIARMESHPEDFNVYNGELYNKTKFGDVAGALYGLVGMDAGKAGAYWFLTDADKEALIEAWKKYHRVAMDKDVMEKIFDDGSEEREREREQAKIRKLMQNSMMNAINPYTTTQIGAGQIHPAQGMAIQGSSYNHNTQTLAFNTSSGALTVGTETIDSSILKKLKALVK